MSLLVRNLLSTAVLMATASYGQSSSPAHPQTALQLVRTISLPEIAGDFNVFAVDIKGNRLFVTADKHGTIELFNLKTGEHLRSIGGLKEPHMLLYYAAKNEIWAGDAGAHAMVILDGSDFHEIGRVPLPSPPTAGLYVPETDTLYMQDDGVDAKLPYSTINVIDVQSRSVLKKIQIEDSNLESMAVDNTGHLYVNLRQSKKVAAVDLKSGQVTSLWTVPDLNLNTPMAIDDASDRLFIAGRKPGRFYVLDKKSGTVVFQSDCINIADQITYDAKLKRIYVTGSQGVSIFSQTGPDAYEKISEFPTNGGKIGANVPALGQFYIIHPKNDIDDAALQVYRITH